MVQLEAMLQQDPTDSFLRYGLAMEYASLGDNQTAATQLLQLTADSEYVPAFLQAGQILYKLDRVEEALAVLRKGTEIAQRQGDHHAASEMSGLISSFE